ncbi:MAG: hypothetical protein Q9162_001407 [Coniocarpon cinnabarinum]
MRRNKIAALLRDHASPPGVRVTAGGRLVPDGTSPLTSPRSEHFGKHDHYPRVPHLPPDSVPNTNTLKQLDGMIVNIGGSQIAQIVNGQILHVGYTNSPLNLYLPPTNPVIPSAGEPVSQQAPYFMPPGAIPLASANTQSPNHHATMELPSPHGFPAHERGTDNGKLCATYEAKLAELQAARQKLDREEVLQRQHINAAVKDHIVKKRKSLTNEISEVREALKQLREANDQHAGAYPERNLNHYSTAGPMPYQVSPLPGLQFSPTQVSRYYAANEPVYPSDAGWGPMHAGFAAAPAPFLGNATATPGDAVVNYGLGSIHHRPHEGHELQERTGNVGLGIMKENTNNQAKWSSQSPEPAGMNLDGSMAQPRRSHAIEIKRPHHSTATGKSTLNPTSPVYDPSQPVKESSQLDVKVPPADHVHKYDSSALTPKRISKTDPLPEARRSTGGSFDHGSMPQAGPTEDSFNTSSTAGTADFFPNDPRAHSSRHWVGSDVQGSSTNLSNWMPREDQGRAASQHMTPNGSTSKSGIHDSESPENTSFKTAANASNRSSVRGSPFRNSQGKIRGFGEGIDVSAKPPPLKLATTFANFREPLSQKGGSVHTSFDSNSHAEDLIEKRRPLPSKKASPIKTRSYWAGFQSGLEQGLCDSAEEDYRVGYRDGLLRSRDPAPINTAPFESTSFPPLTTPGWDVDRSALTASIAELSHSSSLPALHAPRVPLNTAVSTPHRQSTEEQEALKKVATSFDGAQLPSVRSAASIRPSSTNVRAQSSQNILQAREPTSPLARRNLKNTTQQSNATSKGQIPSSRIFSDTAYDQQRYSHKASTSVAPSKSQAQGWIRHQLDGSAEEDDRTARKHTQPSAQQGSSAVKSPKSKERGSASSSPIKRVSSAVVRLTQISGMSKAGSTVNISEVGPLSPNDQLTSSKPKSVDVTTPDATAVKVDDPAKMSGREKAKWKNKWRKRFEELKVKEQQEINDYQKKTP